MNTIALALPPVEAEKTVEVSVTVNGHTTMLRYRVELFKWQDWWTPPEPRAESVKRMIQSYDPHWQLCQIGAPDDAGIPIMFRHVH